MAKLGGRRKKRFFRKKQSSAGFPSCPNTKQTGDLSRMDVWAEDLKGQPRKEANGHRSPGHLTKDRLPIQPLQMCWIATLVILGQAS